jgi:AAA domain
MLNEFLDYVFGGDQEGYFGLSLFKGGKPAKEWFIKVPDKLSSLSERKVQQLGAQGDVYFTPALFHVQRRRMEFCLGSWVSWADVDDVPADVPREAPSCPAAGLLVASGSVGRVHQYRRSEGWLGREALLETNRFFGNAVPGADKSGHDPTQLLRIPGTFNHKHAPPKPVVLLENHGTVYDLTEFRLPQTNLLVPRLGMEEVSVQRWEELTEYTKRLYNSNPPEGTRSDKLFELACRLLEEEFALEEARHIVDEAALKWGKFDRRSDRNEQLDIILHRAQEKTTPPIRIVDDPPKEVDDIDWSEDVGFQTLLTRSPRIEWIIPGVLGNKGLMYLVGPTGIGKTTLAFNLGISIALSKKQWLGYDIEQRERAEKVYVASHEMNSAELVEFLLPMSNGMTPDELAHLEEHFRTRATGQAVALDDERNQKAYETRLRSGGFTGFILDTLGASTKTSLQDETGARKIADWIDKLRQQLGIWCIVIAHPRKVPAGVKNYRFSIDDAYGSRVFGDRANSVFIMQRSKGGVEFDSVKTRFLGGTSTLFLQRDTNHWYEKTSARTETKEPAVKIESELNYDDLKGNDELDL